MKQWINGYKNTITPMHTFISVICVQQKAHTENEAADANRRKIQVKLGSGSTICFHSHIRDDHLHSHCDIAAYIFATIHHYHQQHRGRQVGRIRGTRRGTARGCGRDGCGSMAPSLFVSNIQRACHSRFDCAVYVCTPLLRGINIQYYHNCVCITRCKQ